jgi:lipoate---protein ligase
MQLDDELIDQIKTQSDVPLLYRSWEPQEVAVVLGRSNTTAAEVRESHCRQDGVPILKRRGGGGTVVLSPGILVISLAKYVARHYHFKEYFQQINATIIAVLSQIGLEHLSQQGYSDICLCDRKILGSSMYRSKHLLFYTASLMVSNSTDLIERYLQHPSKEPDYRRGRSHREFLTTIAQEYPQITLDAVKTAMDAQLPMYFADIK